MSKTFDVCIRIEDFNPNELILKLPEWRPGRYCLQNFSKNVTKFSAVCDSGVPLKAQKTNHFTWKINTENAQNLTVKYTYYANQLDAGGCYLLENLIYINWICCAMLVDGKDNELCEIELDSQWPLAGSLKTENGVLIAQNFDHLVDSPVMASPDLTKIGFEVMDCEVFCWFYGKIELHSQFIKDSFAAFIKKQVEIFKDLPCAQYHFLFLILPYKFYHGVEHKDSTVIVLGPDSESNSVEFLRDFMGVSSHEFFHLWNVKRLRPKELLPYNLFAPVHFPTGFVIEGITTYYGDLTLARSGYFDFDSFAFEINSRFQKHFDNLGRFNTSLLDSSMDLWIDGYSQKAPQKGVSIYDKGMVTALILDLNIRKVSNYQTSMDDLMRHLWQNYLQNGYNLEDFFQAVNRVAGCDLSELLDLLYLSAEPLESLLQSALKTIGCCFVCEYSASVIERVFGAKMSLDRFGSWLIKSIEPDSPASKVFSVGDIVHSCQGIKFDEENTVDSIVSDASQRYEITIVRNFELRQVEILSSSEAKYFPIFKISKSQSATEQARNEFFKWCGLEF